mmetsp:Transcript_43991/g.121736  ORF Transcript_43991/g.121736 Transcript_43991/m.121736 type:complete len:261 (-) Transcript_43991:2-784(-)
MTNPLPIGALHDFLEELRAKAVPNQRHLSRVPRLLSHAELLHEPDDLLLDVVILVVREAMQATLLKTHHLRLRGDADKLHHELHRLDAPPNGGLAARLGLLGTQVREERVATEVDLFDGQRREPRRQHTFQGCEPSDDFERLRERVLHEVLPLQRHHPGGQRCIQQVERATRDLVVHATCLERAVVSEELLVRHGRARIGVLFPVGLLIVLRLAVRPASVVDGPSLIFGAFGRHLRASTGAEACRDGDDKATPGSRAPPT